MAQVSCEIATPKDSRPTEGILFVNVELSSMAAPYFESGRQSDMSARVNRLLERCLKESGCVDLESLCIQSGMKVWVIRVDLHVLNNDGNMVDALSVAAIAALNHFRRPDVNVCGEDVTVLRSEERDPLPITMHHLPVCVTFAFFEEGKYILLDPTEMEEHVMDGTLVICMNRHKEICLVQTTGNVSVLNEQISRCKEICFGNVCEITEKIHLELQKDTNSRTPGSTRIRSTVPPAAADSNCTATVVKKAKTPSMPKPLNSEVVEIIDDVEELMNLMDETGSPQVVVIDSDVEEDLKLTVGKAAGQDLTAGAQAASGDVLVVAKKSKKKKKKAKASKD